MILADAKTYSWMNEGAFLFGEISYVVERQLMAQKMEVQSQKYVKHFKEKHVFW